MSSNVVTVVGTRVSTFESKEGRDILYGRLYVLYDEDGDDKDVSGQICEVLKSEPELCEKLEPGMRGVPMYNKYGKCVGFNAE